MKRILFCALSLFRGASVPIILIAFMIMASCREAPRQEFDLHGRVVSVNKDRGQVTLAHEEVEGYMDAMTMPFNVKDDWALSILTPGQKVDAVLVVQENRSWIEDLKISDGEAVENPAGALSLPEPGDMVPDFGLLNQDDRRIHIHQYRGRPLLITFIYTRCPLPDYCPLMSGNFAAIHHSLQSLPVTEKIPHLLTVSFDTDFDKPSVLREYAGRYMKPLQFDRWEFATGSLEEILEITGYFGLAYEQKSGQIIHSLVTVLIGSDGKLVRIYHGNQWRPAEILADLELKGDAR